MSHPSSAKPAPEVDPAARELLRHTLATLAYRSAKVLRGAPEGFCKFKAGEGLRTPVEILAHMGDLFDWALSIAQGAPKWNDATPLDWEAECDRYFAALAAFETFLASDQPLQRRPERLFQAPIADALTHTGQIALLRRMYGAPIRGESYYVAPIQAGRVGPDQDPPGKEFD